MADRKFSSVQEEMEYYKSRYLETQQEFDEFQQDSRELEQEMETQLTQLEKENVELKRNLQKAQTERDVYAEKLAFGTNELKDQLETLERELLEERDLNERLSHQIRELEQDNDDLERAKRALAASLEEFEKNVNQALERNAFLENELDEKEELACMVQRLKEETSDLKRELAVRTRQERTPSITNVVNGNLAAGQQRKNSKTSLTCCNITSGFLPSWFCGGCTRNSTKGSQSVQRIQSAAQFSPPTNRSRRASPNPKANQPTQQKQRSQYRQRPPQESRGVGN